ncbi:ABC transporter ATP-binding protein/permease [bacterium]|nr:ABC transporter ATP-binding protein/permease [bacterium]
MKNSFSIFSEFLSYAKPWRPKIIWASFYSIMNKIFDIAPEILIGIYVDLVVTGDKSFIAKLGFESLESQITLLAIATLLIWVSESTFEYLYSVQWKNIAQGVEHDIRIDTYSHVQDLDLEWYEKQKTGNITAILNDDVNQLERFLNGGFNDILQIIISTIAIGAVFFYISPLIALFAICPIPIILFVASFFQKKLSPKYLDVRNAAGNLSSSIFNNLLGIITIKGFTAEQYETQKILKMSENYQNKNQDAIKLSSAFIPIVRMGVLTGFIGTMIIGTVYTIQGDIAVGSFSVLVFLTQRFLWPFTRLGETIDLFERSMASTKRILELLKTKSKINNKKDAIKIDNLNKTITFENVSFGYTDKPVFKNLNLQINKGDFIGIAGQTGAGKTTLIKLLFRFYEVGSGAIKFDNHNLNNINIQSLRSKIGLVNQEIFLFDGTIKENICYPHYDIDEALLMEVASNSQCLEFIEKLPNGFDTIIGERGQKLSVGQKQRIGIARALYKKPDILIFDEATSAVDNETEYLIQKALKEIAKHCTTIVIAHRLSTIKNSNKIIVLGDKNVSEQGSHDELIENDNFYKQLWNIQTGNN